MTSTSTVDYATNVDEVRQRFLRLYVPAVADALDDFGLPFQTMSSNLTPLDPDMVVAGPAFTVIGAQSSEANPQRRIGPRVIEEITSGTVVCYDTQGDTTTGVWGELWTLGAVHKGCVGAVVDGGIRDSRRILDRDFPIFSSFRRPTDAVGRFTVVDSQCAVTVGGVRVSPGDYIYGDLDGIVVIPAGITLQVLETAEKIVERENLIRPRLIAGESVANVYREFGRL